MNNYQRPHSPFEDSAKERLRRMMQALEHSLRLLAQLRDHPDYAVEYIVKEEKRA